MTEAKTDVFERLRACRVVGGGVERPVAVAEQDAHVVAPDVRDGEIGIERVHARRKPAGRI